jgi:dimethylargininase
MPILVLPHENAKYALVRKIPNSFDHAIKPRSSKEGIDVKIAQRQHEMYCSVLKDLGLELIVLPRDEKHPDCCFTEDAAVVYDEVAIVGRLGAKSRRGEEPAVSRALSKYRKIKLIRAPSMLEGGDVLRIGKTTYVGISRRTNRKGIQQLARFLEGINDVRPLLVTGVLHLKTGVNYLGNEYVTHKTGVSSEPFQQYRIIQVPRSEVRKASFLPVKGKVVIPADCPETARLVEQAGFETIPLDYSEIRKAQAGLTCASIIF